MLPQDARRDRRRYTGTIDDKLMAYQAHHGYPFVVNTYSTFYMWYLDDWNDGTKWISASWMGTQPWCGLDLGSPRSIAKARIFQIAGSHATQLRLDVSNDFTNWTTIHTSPAGLTGGEYLFYPPLLKYRFWKWTAIASSWTYGWEVASLEFWGPVI